MVAWSGAGKRDKMKDKCVAGADAARLSEREGVSRCLCMVTAT